jgi:predicted RNA binding protein YcfA (HicA-like mRNA interferase family)
MDRLGGFRYREIAKRPKSFGFELHRQAAGSHEIWFDSTSLRDTTIPIHGGEVPEGTLRATPKQAGIDAAEFLRA